ncbi:MAG: glycosyltransferase family 2 protein [Thermoplasmatota archaeon]
MKIAVLVTQLNDERALRALDSLAAQSRKPDFVLVADGGSRAELVARMSARLAGWGAVEAHPGSVAETRASALASLAAFEVVAFLDSDEVAPAGWLAALVAPIEADRADFTGGPTRPFAPAKSKTERYLNDFEAWFYPNVVARDIARLPMGNSAWRRASLAALGFDRRLARGGEDYDVNLRAVASGMRGTLVPDAWVYHDQSGLDSFRKLVRRKWRYNVGGALAYLKNGRLGERARTRARFHHRYEWVNPALQPAALAAAWWKWRTLRRLPP